MRNIPLWLARASLLTLVSWHVTAAAQESGDSEESQIIVTGESDGYVATNSGTATKTETPLIDVPQTVSVVTREQIEDQAHHSMADVLRYVPGVTIGQGEGNRDQITIRGQNTTADFFLDGVRDDVQYYRSLYNIERVEVLKGPYAMIFGRGGGGGIVNRVQKTPLAQPLAAGSASINSEGSFDIAADVNQPLGTGMDAALRLNGFYEQLESHRDFVDGERFAINPYIAATLMPGWTLGLSYEHVNDERVPDRGVPSVECASAGCVRLPLMGHTDTFFGAPGINRTGLNADIVKLRIDAELTPDLTWSTTALYGDYDKFYSNVFPNSAVRLSDNTIQLDGYRDDTDRENRLIQSNLVWGAAFGAIENTLLLGVEYGVQDTGNSRYVSPTRPRIDVDDFDYPAFTFPFPDRARETLSEVEVFSAYAQEQIGIGEHVDLIAGVRYDRFEITGTDVVADREFARVDDRISPRFGLILKPLPNVSLYASYSRSFLPRSGDQFISLSPSTQALKPDGFTNHELGAKWEVRPNLQVTTAVFQLDRTNTTTPDPNNPTTTIVAGATRTQGAEVALVGQLTPAWQVSAGYTYQDAHLRGNESIRLAQVPEHQIALWNRYDFIPGLGAGVGVIHQSKQWAALHNPTASAATLLPSSTRLDAALFFDVSERVGLQLNIENLLDEEYFSDAHNNNNITVGAPLNARLTARLKL
jgi:catecholate siderophore receptor